MTFAEWIWTAILFVLCVGGSIGLAIGAYAIGRAFLPSRADKESKDLANSVIIRVSALHSLILALVFAQELINYNEVRVTVAAEAALIGDVFYDLKRYDEKATRPIRRDVAEYVVQVMTNEWPRLAEGKGLHGGAWALWERIYQRILDLKPEAGRQTDLKRIMLADIRQVSGLRLKRLNASLSGLNPWFVSAAIVGILLTAISYFNFAPNAVSIVLISIFGAFTGLIMFFIFIFANPYSAPGAIEPRPFDRLTVGEFREIRSDGGRQ